MYCTANRLKYAAYLLGVILEHTESNWDSAYSRKL